MARKKRERSIIDRLFEGSLFEDTDELFSGLEDEEMSSGYSVSVTQTPEGTKVHAKIGKNVDADEVRRHLQQQYPGAEIEIEGGKPLIKEISTKSLDEKKNRKDQKQ
ncbi:MAG: hypothetical protein ACQXXH_02320 [Candidatus Bathyarchaeia archaeon]|jgi:hypothetical protein|nr:hypothetical protein [Candidatus Bathyarchaeota archaeon A05DMB-4]MDH7594580.1 hypothetical protein [Candidatus Bathyarchaeota archaeon]